MSATKESMEDVKQRPEERGKLFEYSVIYTDRAINMLSEPFQKVMRDLSEDLKATYNANHIAIVPGSGTYAMEAAARQFATDKKVFIIRNGYFSFRWTEIIDTGKISTDCTVLKAQCDASEKLPQFQPYDIEKAVKLIASQKPDVVFAPQVETSTGMIISKDYIKQLADAVHGYGGLLVIDSIAAGTMWLDMKECEVDVIISAPQKGWSGPACCGLVIMNDRAYEASLSATSTSFSCNLTKWLQVMKKYEAGGAMYHTTLPTDSLTKFRNSVKDTIAFGLDASEKSAIELGTKIRSLCEEKGLKSVALKGWEAPTVVVLHTEDASIVGKFKEQGVQVVGGVPFKVDEPEGIICFRIGLFGLDKLMHVERTVQVFKEALEKVLA